MPFFLEASGRHRQCSFWNTRKQFYLQFVKDVLLAMGNQGDAVQAYLGHRLRLLLNHSFNAYLFQVKQRPQLVLSDELEHTVPKRAIGPRNRWQIGRQPQLPFLTAVEGSFGSVEALESYHDTLAGLSSPTAVACGSKATVISVQVGIPDRFCLKQG